MKDEYIVPEAEKKLYYEDKARDNREMAPVMAWIYIILVVMFIVAFVYGEKGIW